MSEHLIAFRLIFRYSTELNGRRIIEINPRRGEMGRRGDSRRLGIIHFIQESARGRDDRIEDCPSNHASGQAQQQEHTICRNNTSQKTIHHCCLLLSTLNQGLLTPSTPSNVWGCMRMPVISFVWVITGLSS